VAVPGPAALGRSVVVGPGTVVPRPWTGRPEIVLDEPALGRPADAVESLHRAWAGRQSVVIRLVVDPARFRVPRSWRGEPWALPAGFDLWEDRLHFLLWANSYDARGDPEQPRWWWAVKASRLGAVDCSRVPGSGDVRLADGKAVWIDGGPRSPFSPGELDGAGLVHAETVDLHRLVVAPPPVPPGAELAADQLAAVAHPGGPARIVAPAGSGKTRVLTERLRHLVVDRGWERDAVLAVAYNKKAQEELDLRGADFGPRTRTLNSLGLWVLGRARGRAPRVLEEREVRSLIERLAPLPRRRVNTDPIAPYVDALGRVRLALLPPEDVENERDDTPGLAELFPAYRAELKAAGAVDFDDQIYGAVEELLADGDLRRQLQRSCPHLLVDEFQDLTRAHVMLVRLLALPGLDVFAVGDDDQVIYGHAGADPGFLIDFSSWFPTAAHHALDVNYRCSPAVVDAAVHLLGYNRARIPKSIRAGRVAGRPGDFEIRRPPEGEAAAAAVAFVHQWQEEGVPSAQIALLARVNSLLLAPHIALVEAGLLVNSALRPEVLERTGLRAALAYLRIAVAEDGELAQRDLVEILRRPSRGLPPWFPDRLRRRTRWRIADLRRLAAAVPDRQSDKVAGLVRDLDTLRRAAGAGASTSRLLSIVGDEIGLGQAMGLLDRSRGGEGASHLDDLQALAQVARLHEEATTFERWLRNRFTPAHDPAGVTVSTVHRVKGMEWDRVIVYGVDAGILPHRLAEDVEEERRVLHVAITRGRDRVVVLGDRSRPSRFLDELTGVAPAERAPRPPAADRAATVARGRRPAAAAPARRAPAPALEAALRKWRGERSRRDGVPAYVVFSDRTLQAIAVARPDTLVALRSVDGIGPAKLEAYGEAILDLVARHG
jgi:DNA helicase-2/ATP-dependent DNA helicase PcrA